MVGYDESTATPSVEGIQGCLSRAAARCIGRRPFENARLMGEIYNALVEIRDTCSAVRPSGQVMCARPYDPEPWRAEHRDTAGSQHGGDAH